MSFGRKSIGIVAPALVAVLAPQACATAEEVDQLTQQAIVDGALVGQAMTTPVGVATTPAGQTPSVPTTPAGTQPMPATTPSMTAQMPVEPAAEPPATPGVEPAPPAEVPQAPAVETPAPGAGGTPAAPAAPAAGGAAGAAVTPDPMAMGGGPAAGGVGGGAAAGGAGGAAAMPAPPGLDPAEVAAILEETDVELYYQATATAAEGPIAFKFYLVNNGTLAVPLEEMTVRYWFTSGGLPCEPIEDYVPSVVSPLDIECLTTDDGLEYIEFSYPEFGLANGAQPNQTEVQIRFQQSNPGYDQTDDYSFVGTSQSSMPNDKMTAYRQGVLVWGTEPTP